MSFPQLHAGRDEPILEPDLPIVDAHHHLLVRPGLRYLLDDYLADAQAGHRIVASVYMEVLTFARRDGPQALRPLGEIEFANGYGAMCAGGYSTVQACAGIVGQADMRLGDGVAGLLDRALQAAPERFRGVRQIAIDHPSEAFRRFVTNPPPRGLYRHPAFDAAVRQVAQRQLVFDAAVFHNQLDDLMALADRFPDMTIVLGHCGHAMALEMGEAETADVYRALHRSMLELGRRPNVHCKIGGLGLPFWNFRLEQRSDPIGYQELATLWRPFVEMAIEAFGPRRCMMESNFPMDGRSAGFVPLWNALKHIVRGASAQDKAALFHDTAVQVYRLQIPAN